MDFNKIIPRPESLDIEAGSKTYRGLEAYKGFIALYIHGRDAADALRALENIPLESEELFLRQRTDIRRDEWELGKTAWQNMQKYGAPTWYEWSTRNWGTKWNACGYEEGVVTADAPISALRLHGLPRIPSCKSCPKCIRMSP